MALEVKESSTTVDSQQFRMPLGRGCAFEINLAIRDFRSGFS